MDDGVKDAEREEASTAEPGEVRFKRAASSRATARQRNRRLSPGPPPVLPLRGDERGVSNLASWHKTQISDVTPKPEAAERLNTSVRSVERLISRGKLKTVRVLREGRWHRDVSVRSIERLIDRQTGAKNAEWFDKDLGVGFTVLDEGGSREGPILGGLPELRYFFRRGDTTDSDRPPEFALTVGLWDLYRFKFARLGSAEEQDRVRTEIRDRLPGKPESFAVKFTLDLADTGRQVLSVANRYIWAEELKQGRQHDPDLPVMATTKLVNTTGRGGLLHRLGRCPTVQDLERYIGAAAVNFARDLWRNDRRLAEGDALGLDRLDEP